MTTPVPPPGAGHGVAVWSTAAWRDDAVTWLDAVLAGAGWRGPGT